MAIRVQLVIESDGVLTEKFTEELILEALDEVSLEVRSCHAVEVAD